MTKGGKPQKPKKRVTCQRNDYGPGKKGKSGLFPPITGPPGEG